MADAPTTLILGAGVMGTALTFPLADAGGDVTLVGTHLDDKWIEAIRRSRVHPKLGMRVPAGITALHHSELPAALARKPGLVVLGVSSPGVPWAVSRLSEHLQTPTPLLLLTKGLAARDKRIVPLTEIVATGLARAREWRVGDVIAGGVGGPCIAAELAARRETHVVIGVVPSLATTCRARFHASYYHVRYTTDIAGVELSAALKNFFAIGVGTAAGLLKREGLAANGATAHNPAAALFAQAVSEIAYLVSALGGRAETAIGQAGTGDLYVTCQAGRNMRLGALLGTGIRIGEARKQMAGETVEGADLALEIGPVLRNMMREGSLEQWRLPLTRAILEAVVDGSAWQEPDPESLAHMEE